MSCFDIRSNLIPLIQYNANMRMKNTPNKKHCMRQALQLVHFYKSYAKKLLMILSFFDMIYCAYSKQKSLELNRKKKSCTLTNTRIFFLPFINLRLYYIRYGGLDIICCEGHEHHNFQVQFVCFLKHTHWKDK